MQQLALHSRVCHAIQQPQKAESRQLPGFCLAAQALSPVTSVWSMRVAQLSAKQSASERAFRAVCTACARATSVGVRLTTPKPSACRSRPLCSASSLSFSRSGTTITNPQPKADSKRPPRSRSTRTDVSETRTTMKNQAGCPINLRSNARTLIFNSSAALASEIAPSATARRQSRSIRCGTSARKPKGSFEAAPFQPRALICAQRRPATVVQLQPPLLCNSVHEGATPFFA